MRRTRRAIAADDPEQFELSLLLAGTQELHQADRDAVLGPGDLVCMDSSRPYRVSSPDAFEMLVFAVPKVLLRPHVDVVGARTASAIPARAGLAALVAPFLRWSATGCSTAPCPRTTRISARASSTSCAGCSPGATAGVAATCSPT